MKLLLSAALLALLTAACPRAEVPTLELYDIELREKNNTCRELDPQVAKEMIFLERIGPQGVLHLGAERAFPVELGETSITAEFLETDHASVAGRHVVCKRITVIDLTVDNGALSGSYERRRRQECLLDAKPCATTWSVTGSLRPAPAVTP